MKIGSIKISSNPVLALSPMAGYTNVVFRELMAKSGADITYTELASAAALSRESDSSISKTGSIIQTSKSGISAVQLFGANKDEFEFAVKHVCQKIETGDSYAKFIDINLGCPAQKVTKTGSGSQLLTTPKKLEEIVNACLKISSVPITAKLRLLPKTESSIKIAKMLQSCGLSALAFHGRTQEQGYSGKSNWGELALLRQNLELPMFANGDVKTPQDVKKIIEVTGCQAVMVGRAALANPYFFTHTRQFFEGKTVAKPSTSSNINFIHDYISLSKKYNSKFIYSKELAIQFFNGFSWASKARQLIVKTGSFEQLETALSTLSSQLS